MKISSSFLAKAADVKISLEANSKTLLAKKVASHPSLAAKEKRSYGSQKTIQGHFNDPDAPHQIKSTSCFLGFILCLCLLLHGPASWLSSSEFQNRVWKKIEITAKPAQNLALQATELQQTKVNLGYDIASGSSVYCNGDPVNGLDPDGRCVESTLNAVPGQAAWQQSVSSFNNGDYGQATLSFGLMLSEQALTVATFGMGSVASAGGEVASSVAAEVGGAQKEGSVFWSGGMQTRQAAEAYASTIGGQTLEMTLPGKFLNAITTKQTYPLLKPLWAKASLNFAKNAEGAVDVFHSATRGVRVESFWTKFEYPQLIKQGNQINFFMAP